MRNDMDGVIFDITCLKNDARIELSQILKITPDEAKLHSIIKALENATIIQKTVGNIGAGMTQGGFRNTLLSLKRHLEQSLKRLQEIPDSYLQLLEQSCWHASEYDKSFITVPKDRSTLIDKQSVFLAGINFHLQYMSEPTKEKHEYSAGIAHIHDQYSKIFPDKKISSHRNSVFTKVIIFWLAHYLEEQAFIPQRQIEKVLR